MRMHAHPYTYTIGRGHRGRDHALAPVPYLLSKQRFTVPTTAAQKRQPRRQWARRSSRAAGQEPAALGPALFLAVLRAIIRPRALLQPPHPTASEDPISSPHSAFATRMMRQRHRRGTPARATLGPRAGRAGCTVRHSLLQCVTVARCGTRGLHRQTFAVAMWLAVKWSEVATAHMHDRQRRSCAA